MRRLFMVSTIFLAIGSLYAQEVLTNETLLKLKKAGLGEDVILGMVNKQPGRYSLDSDSIISLKQVGFSDRVITAMIGKSANSAGTVPAEPAITAPGTLTPLINGKPGPVDPNQPLILHDATPVRLRLSRNLSSADAKAGDTIDFEVLDDVKVNDCIVIQRSTMAIGTVTDAEKKKNMGRAGKLDVTIDYVRVADGSKIALRGAKETSGNSHAGAMTGGIVATALIAWPAAPFFLFMHGKDTTIPKGTEITAYVNGEIKLDPQKFTAR